MPKLEAVLKEIGATNAETYVPPDPDAGKYTLRPLTADELLEYNAKKEEHEKKMLEWEANRREELKAQGTSVEEIMEKCRPLNPSTQVIPSDEALRKAGYIK